MGEVYRAHDPTLHRLVALKILPAQRAASFLREARAQARVDHEGICKVYEVGEVDGLAYIAMRLVPGEPLAYAAEKLPLDTLVRLFRQVAEALHAAHREGLIHRDVKPGNVIVEAGEDGAVRASVVDFGLAMELDQEQSLHEGAAGTPAYMAPEQALGEIKKIDRRTDVYGLGVTMWEALAGRPMIGGSSVYEILLKVIDKVPVSIEKARPGIPKDLATIVMKSVEKAPERRYDSARALADDLGRFLDGDPIAARPVGVLEALARRARKHRTITAAVAVATLAVLGFGGAAVVTSVESVRRQAAAQEFGQAVERMEWTMRQARLLPAHDIRPARRKVETQMRGLEEAIRLRGRLGEGPGHYALGRGNLELGRPEEARREIERAHSAGYRTPETARLMGNALFQLYQKEWAKAEQIQSPATKAARLKKIASDLRQPALAALRAARAGPDTALLEGSLAYLEDKLDEARAFAEKAFEDDPALYEALKLKGDAEVLKGKKAKDKGEYDLAFSAWAEAGAAYRRAAEIGRSDPAVFLSECHRLLFTFELELRIGKDAAESYERGKRACQTASSLDPGLSEPLTTISRYEWQRGDALGLGGKDADPALLSAQEAAERAIAIDPKSGEAWANLGITFWTRSESEDRKSKDPIPFLSKAAEALARAEALEPTGAHLMDLGSVQLETGRALMKGQKDPRPSFAAARTTYEAALRLIPDDSRLHSNIGNISKLTADYELEAGRDSSAYLKEAIRNYQKAIELNPKSHIARFNLAESCLALARTEMMAGRDPVPLIQTSMEHNRQAAAINPKFAHPLAAIANAFLLLADNAERLGKDPREHLQGAVTSAQAALAINASLEPARKCLELARGRLATRARGTRP
ncbi:MAG: protein kinase [Thermoanaerobaculia bacterium]|nr:protein kinase [Thermoanaerobaculia bacterium]